jgi:hypothetical protein
VIGALENKVEVVRDWTLICPEDGILAKALLRMIRISVPTG